MLQPSGLLLIVLSCCTMVLALAEHSPVLLWGITSEVKPSLVTISQLEFAQLIANFLSNKSLVVFMENGLTSKDFLCSTADHDGECCYSYLQSTPHRNYYASVENPIDALHLLTNDYVYHTLDANGVTDQPLTLTPNRINFIQFKNNNTDIRGHDAAIAKFTSSISEDNIFYMYTTIPKTNSFENSQRLVRRKVRETTGSGHVFHDDGNLLLYFKSLMLQKANSTINELTVSQMNTNVVSESSISVELTTNSGALTFAIDYLNGYFKMNHLMYGNTTFRTGDISAPTEFSYSCDALILSGEGVNNEMNSDILYWNGLQFQAPFAKTKNPNFKFGDPWYCVGFFSTGILMGLFIVVLLLVITFIGITCMMDINTMDRFDDPKGKTITINANE